MNKITWKEIGYLEGLRVGRNNLRRAVKTYHENGSEEGLNFLVKLKIQSENHYKMELERLCSENKELKEVMDRKFFNDTNIAKTDLYSTI